MELETGEDEYSIQEDGSLVLTGMPIYAKRCSLKEDI
jgi:hypothetical protein